MKRVIAVLGLLTAALAGCSDTVELFTPEDAPAIAEIVRAYRMTELGETSSADVLAMMQLQPNELMSQSESVVAVYGEKKKNKDTVKRWFKMVTFDDDDFWAKRKYLFIVDERPKFLFVEPWEGLLFDCQMIIKSDVLDEPYADENARRIAILKRIKDNIRDDMLEVAKDNNRLNICGMMVRQNLEAVLALLDESPAMAARLDSADGLQYEHINMDEGRIRMTLDIDIAAIRIEAGSVAKDKVVLPVETLGSDAHQY